MELRLVVRAAGRASEVAVEAEPPTPIAEVLAELERYLELPPGTATSATCARTGRVLAGDLPLDDARLRDGDELVLGEGDAPAHVGDGDALLVDLVVVGGPESGLRVGLPAGRHVVGRGPGADVVIADRSMSRRHLVVDVAAGAVSIGDAGSRNGTFVEGAAVTATRGVLNGEQVEAGRSLIAFEPRRERKTSDHDGSVVFNRPPRLARPAAPEPIALPAPPADAADTRLPSIAALVPLVVGVVMWQVTGNALLLMFAALAPLMAMTTYLDTRRQGRSARKRSVRDFDAEVERAAARLEEARRTEAEQRRAAAPDAGALRGRVERLDSALWERRPRDEDFLELRVGTADLPSAVPVEIAPGGDDAARARAAERLDAARPLVNVPVTLALADGAAGIAADAAKSEALARWLLVQAAILHSPRELEIGAVLADGRAQAWRWLSWLPHVPGGAVVTGRAAGSEMLARERGGRRRLVLVDGDAGVPPSSLDAALDAGTAVVWLAGAPHELPGACATVLTEEGAALALTEMQTGAVVRDIAADGVTAAWAEETARELAGIRDAGGDDGRSAVPKRVSLLDLLRLPDPSRAALVARWQAAADRDVSAPIGVTADGPFEIDVGRPEGLRMVVAGMPGAGKSELLQTMIAALAANNPPTLLTFLLVDYKGGSAFRDCAELPHTVGLVTDLDAHLADRARVSLLAELRRREHLLRDAGAKSLRELRRRAPDRAPASLLIVVDEFATLARELPAFVDTVVDVAQRGRSLGVHLVLATQRPRGAVTDALRANTNLRIAMRVSDAAESRDVIEAPDAASIPAALAGRALALTGRRSDGSPELTEVQIAYVGGRTSGLGARRTVTVRPLGGPHQAPVERVLSTVGGSLPTDLQAIVAAALDADEELGLPAPAEPWLPVLPPRLELEPEQLTADGSAVIGMVDEPERQAQTPLRFVPSDDGNLVVYGTSGSGKTSLLRTLACSLAESASPLELQLYALDFASRGLTPLEALPHCGAVIGADDDERVLRLLAWLGRVVTARKRRAGRGELTPGTEETPRLVVLVDGYAGFSAAFERVAMGEPVRTLGRLAAEGRPLGVHVVLTADRRADVPGALSGVIPARVVLRMASEDEFAALGAPRGAAGADLPPGRGFTREGAELQVAWVGPEALERWAARLTNRHGDARAPSIGRLPTRIHRDALPRAGGPLQAVVGLDDEHLQPLVLDLSDTHLLVAGPHRSGVTTALGTIAAQLRAADPAAELHLVAPRASGLAALPVWTTAAEGPDAAAALERLAAGVGEPAVIVVDDAMELGEGTAATHLEALLRRSRDARVRLVAGVDVHAALRAYGGWVRDMRADRTGLLLQPNPDTDGELLGTRLSLRAGAALPPGRGFLVVRGEPRLVQLAMP